MHLLRDVQEGIKTSQAIPLVVNGLVLDDSIFDRKLIKRMCQASPLNIHLEEVDRLDRLPDVLERIEFDIILTDYNLPVGNGLDGLSLIQKSSRNALSPVVLITGQDQSKIAVKALKMGCADYITKDDLNVERLTSVVQSLMAETADARKKRQAESQAYLELSKSIESDVAQHLQPDIAGLVRNLRRMREAAGAPDEELVQALEALERQGIALWSKLMTPTETDPDPRS